MGFTKTVIFLAQFRDNLLTIEGDTGGRAVIEKMGERVKLVAIENGIAGMDFDTEEEYERIQKLMPG